jgi:hypothetical protein
MARADRLSRQSLMISFVLLNFVIGREWPRYSGDATLARLLRFPTRGILMRSFVTLLAAQFQITFQRRRHMFV